jgi:hypothetical protein
MDQKHDVQDQADRSRRWREGVKQQLAALTDRLGDNARQQERRQ